MSSGIYQKENLAHVFLETYIHIIIVYKVKTKTKGEYITIGEWIHCSVFIAWNTIQQ